VTVSYLTLSAHDPIIARDGRPFGANQGNRMHGLPWPYPSVVAGSFRTALVKANGGDFTGDTPKTLLEIPVAGVFPVAGGELHLPAPNDCVVEQVWRKVDGKKVKEFVAHAAVPEELRVGEGADWPERLPLRPVLLRRESDFKPATGPAWCPVEQLAGWLLGRNVTLDSRFLGAAVSQVRDHVQLDADTGAAAESRLFSTTGLSVTHLPRFGVEKGRFEERFAEITLAARVGQAMERPTVHPLGGERRLVHWQPGGDPSLWECPQSVRDGLAGAKWVRMVLATPAVFAHGWRPAWLDGTTLTGTPPGCQVRLKLAAVSIARWKAVSGWSLAEPRGPKPVKRLVPAGGVYFFETDDNAKSLSDCWLQPVSDDAQDRRDGFGLAVWGTW
jgi:CRISPR-associated protein Cmr3